MSLKDRLLEIYDSYSKRNQQAASGERQMLITPELRNRVVMFWMGYINGTLPFTTSYAYNTYALESFWAEMHQALQHLYGRPLLSERGSLYNANDDLMKHLDSCRTEEFFDFMELAFKLPVSPNLMPNSDDIVDAINEIFRVEDLPYELTRWISREEPRQGSPATGLSSGGTQIITTALPQVIRVDETVPHEQGVRPALAALSAPHFSQANEEFLDALKKYRNGDYDDCLVDCGSALESVLKVLCDRRQWSYAQTDTLQKLLNAVLPNTNLDSFFSQPIMLVGTMRNKLSSAHGAGTKTRSVPRHIAQFALTSTAAAIILLVEEVDR